MTTHAHERMLRWFRYEHLREDLKPVSAQFSILADNLCNELPPSAERTVALRKLLEAKDAAVRAKIESMDAPKAV